MVRLGTPPNATATHRVLKRIVALVAVVVLWYILTRSVMLFEEKGHETLKTRTVVARLSCENYKAGLLEVVAEVHNPKLGKVAVCCVPEGESGYIPKFSRGSPCGGRRDLTASHTFVAEDNIVRGQNDVLISSARSLRAVWTKQLSSKKIEELCASSKRQRSAAVLTVFLENHNMLVSNDVVFTASFWHSSPYSPGNFLLPDFLEKRISDAFAAAQKALRSGSGGAGGSSSTWMTSAIRSIGRPVAKQYAKVRPISTCYEARAVLGKAAQSCNFPKFGMDFVEVVVKEVCGLVKAGHLGVTCIILLNVLAYVALQPKSGWEISGSNCSLMQNVKATFGHANLYHLLANMLALSAAGSKLSSCFGCDPILFWLFYLFSGLAGNLLPVLLQPNVRTIGASGAISGVILALTMLDPHPAILLFGRHASSPLVFLAVTLSSDITRDIQSRSVGNNGISYLGHLGGGLGGLFLAWLYAAL
jgi:membrane associated rhomboid family serine protease